MSLAVLEEVLWEGLYHQLQEDQVQMATVLKMTAVEFLVQTVDQVVFGQPVDRDTLAALARLELSWFGGRLLDQSVGSDQD